MSVTPIYAALIALIFLWLSTDVIRNRRRVGASLGDKGDKRLETAIRAHGNCAEYAPIGLLLIGFAELQSAPLALLHILGLSLLAGRVFHGFGLKLSCRTLLPRQIGMVLTFAALLVGAASNLVLVF